MKPLKFSLVASLLLITIVLVAESGKWESLAEIPVNKTSIPVLHTFTAPTIDGKINDECWSEQPPSIYPFSHDRTSMFTVKVCHDTEYIYLLVSYPSKRHSRSHRQWHWSPKDKYYIPGNEQEETFSVLWTEDKVPSINKADIWFWRSARTDPAGYADDYYYLRNSLDSTKSASYMDLNRFTPDEGHVCWYSKYFGPYRGEVIKRFYQQIPTGSAGDVKAKGDWKDGYWTIEFRRKIKTGQNDDVAFRDNNKVYLQFRVNYSDSKETLKSSFFPIDFNTLTSDSEPEIKIETELEP